MPGEKAMMRLLRDARVDRVAMAGLLAAVLCDLPDAAERIDAAVLAARDVANRAKPRSQRRELAERIIEVGTGVECDLRQLAERTGYVFGAAATTAREQPS